MLYKIKIKFIKLKYKIKFHKQVFFSKGVSFRSGFKIQVESKGKITIGKNCFFNNFCSINSLESVTIGDNCIFGEGVKIYDHNHVFNNEGVIQKQGFKSCSVKIGSNCWLGSNVIVLKNAEIGDNCVIGAGCIINEAIPNNTIVRCKQVLQKENIIVKRSN